jgi:hypothetical protein
MWWSGVVFLSMSHWQLKLEALLPHIPTVAVVEVVLATPTSLTSTLPSNSTPLHSTSLLWGLASLFSPEKGQQTSMCGVLQTHNTCHLN